MKQNLKTIGLFQQKILVSYLIVLTIGVILGVIYVFFNTNFSSNGTLKHFNGISTTSQMEISLEEAIPEHFPLSLESLLINTHGHIISFSFIFLTVLLIFSYSSFPENKLKSILIIEPFISIITTFGSIWGIRFVSDYFIILMFISSILLYGSFFFIVFYCLKDLLSPNTFKKS